MTKPGEVYRVDLGMGGTVRMMMVVSRHDDQAPGALSFRLAQNNMAQGHA